MTGAYHRLAPAKDAPSSGLSAYPRDENSTTNRRNRERPPPVQSSIYTVMSIVILALSVVAIVALDRRDRRRRGRSEEPLSPVAPSPSVLTGGPEHPVTPVP
jgi:hypothetical protein